MANSGWNNRVSRMLLLWLRQISLNFDAHYREATRLNKIDGRYVTALTSFAALSAVVSLVSLIDFGVKWVTILLPCVTVAASIIVVWANNMRDRHKFEENAIRNRQVAELYVLQEFRW